MAQLKKTVLGKVSGALGDIVFRERNGINYVGLRPSSFIPGLDPASVARRQRFALALRAGSAINSVHHLKYLWQALAPSGLSAYNYIVKGNYPFVTATGISDLLKLVPGNGFGVIVTDSNIDRLGVRATIDPIGTNAGIITANEPDIMMASLVFLSSPLDESFGAYSIMSFVSPQQATNLGQELMFNAASTNQQQQVFDKYQITKTFIAIFTLDAGGNPVHFSSTALLQ